MCKNRLNGLKTFILNMCPSSVSWQLAQMDDAKTSTHQKSSIYHESF